MANISNEFYNRFHLCYVMTLSFWTDSVDLDQTASKEQSAQGLHRFLGSSLDQGLHCLPFRLHCLDALLYDRATLFEF